MTGKWKKKTHIKYVRDEPRTPALNMVSANSTDQKTKRDKACKAEIGVCYDLNVTHFPE